MAKLPSFQFYPGDWMKDPALRACSLAARGLWLDLLCLMFECDRRGYLQINGKPMSLEQIARATGCSTDEASRCLQELDDSGVFSRSEHGSIYSRRLVRDDQTRAARSEAGSRGGSKTQANRKANAKQKSSSSSSTSSSTSVKPPRPPPGAFELFWKAFPRGRRTGKRAAAKAFDAAVKRGIDAETLIAAAAEYAASPVGRGEYVKGPAPWLNQGCWDDDRAAWQRRSNGAVPPAPIDPQRRAAAIQRGAAEALATSIIKAGRRANKPDEEINADLKAAGVEWPK